MKIKIGELLPNPYKIQINEGKLNHEKITLLKESIEKSGFWDNVLCRKNKDGKYELAYGHHRLEATKQIFGKDHVIDIPCRELSNEDMVRILANENNMQNEDYAIYQVDTVVMTKKFLEGVQPLDTLKGKTGDQKHSQGIGSRQISEFLGEKNWSHSKVAGYLSINEKLHPSILAEMKNMANKANSHGDGPVVISVRHANSLSRLPKKEQIEAVKTIKKYNLSGRATAELVNSKINGDTPIVIQKMKEDRDFKDRIKTFESRIVLLEIIELTKSLKKVNISDYPKKEIEIIHKLLTELKVVLKEFERGETLTIECKSEGINDGK